METCTLPVAAGRPAAATRTYALVSAPNVGKSVVLHRLTGSYASVSNHPGSRVDVARAPARFDGDATVLDTPGALAARLRRPGCSRWEPR